MHSLSVLGLVRPTRVANGSSCHCGCACRGHSAQGIVREGKAVHLNAVAVLRCFWSRAALVEGQTDGIEVRAPYER